MATLDLNIEALQFPVDDGPSKKIPGKPLSGMISVFKSKSKPSEKDIAKDIEVPKEYSHKDFKTFLILRDFLQPNSSISLVDAVDRIFEAVGVGNSNTRSYIYVCLELAEQIPYHHPSQVKLAQVLYMIGRSEKRIQFSGLQDVKRASIVTNEFYQNLNEELTDNRGDPGDDDADPMRYVNYQAFLANLLDAGIWRPDGSFAVAAMRGAFEDDRKTQDPSLREAWIMGAAQWILWNGQTLFKLIRQPDDEELESRTITLKKWQAWKEGFKDVADGDTYGEECKSVAERAFGLMDVLERNMSF